MSAPTGVEGTVSRRVVPFLLFAVLLGIGLFVLGFAPTRRRAVGPAPTCSAAAPAREAPPAVATLETRPTPATPPEPVAPPIPAARLLRGRVVRRGGVSALPGVAMQANWAGAQARSDAEGRFVLEVPDLVTTVQLSAVAPGFATVQMNVEESEFADVRVEMDSRGRLVGSVVDDRGLPARDTEVSAWNERTSTDARGEFAFDEMPLDTPIRVTARGPRGATPRPSEVTIPGTAPRGEVRLALVRTAELSVRVVRPDGGAVDGPCTVGVESDDRMNPPVLFEQATDATGVAVLSGLRVGRFRIVAEGAGFDYGVRADVAVPGAEEITVALSEPAAHSTSGRVQTLDGVPVSGARVVVRAGHADHVATTASDGRFRLDRLPLPPPPRNPFSSIRDALGWRLRITATGLVGCDETAPVDGDTTYVVGPPVTITGRLVLPDGGPPPAGYMVGFVPDVPPRDLGDLGVLRPGAAPLDTRTARTGVFSIAGVIATSGRLGFSVPGRLAFSVAVAAPRPHATTIDVGTVVSPAGGRLVGTVRSASPIPRTIPVPRVQLSDAQGRFPFGAAVVGAEGGVLGPQRVPEGRWLVRAEIPGFVSDVREIDVREGAETALDLDVFREGSLTVVVPASRRPAGTASTVALVYGGPHRVAFRERRFFETRGTAEGGRFRESGLPDRLPLAPDGTGTFRRLPPGTYLVRLESAADPLAEQSVDLAEGAAQRVELDRDR